MRVPPRQPNEIMNDVLSQQFENNEYFKFSEFAEKVNAAQSHYPIDGDMMRDFIYGMIDQHRIRQEYVGDDVSPMLTEEQKANAPNKSIRFKLITPQV